MIDSLLHYPGWPLIIWMVFALIPLNSWRKLLSVGAPIAIGFWLWQQPAIATWHIDIAGYTLTPFHLDSLSLCFALIFALVSLIANIYAWNDKNPWVFVSAQW